MLDVRFGFLRWDYDRTPGNLGTNLVQTFGLPETAVRPNFRAQRRIPGMETIPTIAAGSNSFISTGLHLRRQQVVLGDADADEDCRRSHAQGRAPTSCGRRKTTSRTTRREARSLQQRADGARRHQPGRHGRSVRIVPARSSRQAARTSRRGSTTPARDYQAYFRRRFLADQLRS